MLRVSARGWACSRLARFLGLSEGVNSCYAGALAESLLDLRKALETGTQDKHSAAQTASLTTARTRRSRARAPSPAQERRVRCFHFVLVPKELRYTPFQHAHYLGNVSRVKNATLESTCFCTVPGTLSPKVFRQTHSLERDHAPKKNPLPKPKPITGGRANAAACATARACACARAGSSSANAL